MSREDINFTMLVIIADIVIMLICGLVISLYFGTINAVYAGVIGIGCFIIYILILKEFCVEWFKEVESK